jgi:hypothetical protein
MPYVINVHVCSVRKTLLPSAPVTTHRFSR